MGNLFSSVCQQAGEAVYALQSLRLRPQIEYAGRRKTIREASYFLSYVRRNYPKFCPDAFACVSEVLTGLGATDVPDTLKCYSDFLETCHSCRECAALDGAFLLEIEHFFVCLRDAARAEAKRLEGRQDVIIL